MEIDLTHFDTLEQFLDKVSDEIGEPDFLINNAAYQQTMTTPI